MDGSIIIETKQTDTASTYIHVRRHLASSGRLCGFSAYIEWIVKYIGLMMISAMGEIIHGPRVHAHPPSSASRSPERRRRGNRHGWHPPPRTSARDPLFCMQPGVPASKPLAQVRQMVPAFLVLTTCCSWRYGLELLEA